LTDLKLNDVLSFSYFILLSYRIEYNLYNKRACPTKNEPQQGISYLEREREGVREREGWEGVRERGVSGSEREKGWRVSRSADRLI
jgi:hypothetical protein